MKILVEPTEIDCTKISKTKEIDAYLEKFRLAIIESVLQRRVFTYYFKFNCFEVIFQSFLTNFKDQENYYIRIYIAELKESTFVSFNPSEDYRFKNFNWVNYFEGSHFAKFTLNKNGPEILDKFFQILKSVFKIDVMIAFS